MLRLLCRNRVEDFARWKAIFSAHEAEHAAAGMKLVEVCRSVEDPNNIFFWFEIASMDRALTYISNVEAANVGAAAGVIDGTYHFLDAAGGY